MLSKEQEENLHGFTGDMKNFLREGDFESALILVGDLKKYILEIRKSKSTHFNRNNLDASMVQATFANGEDY